LLPQGTDILDRVTSGVKLIIFILIFSSMPAVCRVIAIADPAGFAAAGHAFGMRAAVVSVSL